MIMGYCYTTGKKVNGRWKFLKCDGRSSKCAQDGSIVPSPGMGNFKDVARCSSCVEYCHTWTLAKQAVEEHDKQMED